MDDLFVADHGWDYDPFPGEKNLLLLNVGNVLTDVTDANLSSASTFTHGAAAGDLNGDTCPDLFLNNYSGEQEAVYEERAWLNNCAGVFSETTIQTN